jgi:hypothetical protein
MRRYRRCHDGSLYWTQSKYSVVGIATRYGLDGLEIESRWGRDFPHLSAPWNPPNLLYNGYQFFPGGKVAGVWRWHLPQTSVEVKDRLELFLYHLPFWTFVACFKVNFTPSKYYKLKSCSFFLDWSKSCGCFINGDTFTAAVSFIVCTNDDGVVMMNPLRRNCYLCTTKFHLFNVYGFNVHGSVHLKNILINVQQDAMLHSLFYLETAVHL